MKPEEAKFILRAYRCDRAHRHDALFAEALAEANSDPALLEWLAREQAFDAAIAEKVEKVAPPPDLRDNILAGIRASRGQPSRNIRLPLWIIAGAIAAAMVVAFTIPSLLPSRHSLAGKAPGSLAQAGATATGGSHAFDPTRLARFAVENLVHGPHRHVTEAAALNLEQALSMSQRALTSTDGLDFVNLLEVGCQTFPLEDRQVVEICFKRDGRWYHLYVTRCEQTPPSGPIVAEHDGISVATWADGRNVFAVATRAGPDAIRRVI
ncbi:MAG: hypothetical protein D6781_10080 [Verrucomicrobia bacterium]|nr:MAG: hypothetical protein D6781_10080 [Verrucomicrobiota bacterium]